MDSAARRRYSVGTQVDISAYIRRAVGATLIRKTQHGRRPALADQGMVLVSTV